MSSTEILSPPVWVPRLATDGQLATDRPAVLTHDGAWDAAIARVQQLSDRELDVFRLLAKGASNRTIAARLAITERTAKAHVAQILAKLQVESRLQAGIVGFAWEVLNGCGRGGSAPSLSALPSHGLRQSA
ncbi:MULTISPECIES: helix-turn-helix domain-containing protein [Streptomyces]|uniref:helix-turn-helix domain-containing protein n=1 Tax=Streptomyces TaxID=1883 RepID=UPI000690B8E1|nr:MULTISPECIES: helix-turn-helix transcriptional regulator [Streptomyces]